MRRTLSISLIAGCWVSVAIAETPDASLDELRWLDQVKWIVQPEDKRVFERLDTEPERQAFIEEFWKKRDPTPGTPENEARVEHRLRLELAIRELGEGRPGWDTDRGRILILHGLPDGRYGAADHEIWTYTSAAPAQAGLEPFAVVFRYMDPNRAAPLMPRGDPQGVGFGTYASGTGLNSMKRYVTDLSARAPGSLNYELVNAGPADYYVDPVSQKVREGSLRGFEVRRKLIEAILRPHTP